ncbi:ABC transporter ATP-binding protein [Psychrobacillus vulpis]|uniref:ABC transporter ATP-binding protein n=1 Tax=Psychrobacillus vulpis TaxID=2325572 RepID=A0A544TJB3_9BACI|nr:ABC transporter ATP-binding protein [Psychrobacillus vulpis]TQR17513.1 ABC transporter ATP-binding protein [Psychrobacillus vulpis]
MIEPIIEVKDLTKQYKIDRKYFWAKDTFVKAVNNLSLQLHSGETFGLVGESGCGKSTTGQIILQLIKQTSGKVLYKGEDISRFSSKRLKAWRRKVQIVFQDPYSSLNPKKTIQWTLNEPLEIHGIGTKESRQELIIKTLEDVGLDANYLKRMPHELSGGQRQRIAIASAIILNPEFIVVDEGVSALDVSVQAQILNLLKNLQRKYQLTYLFISHDLNVVQYFCDRIAVMYLGEIVEIIKSDETSLMPKHPYSQALFSSIPQAFDNGQENIVLKGDIPSPSDLLPGCTFETRCPLAMEVCKKVKPTFKKITENHIVSCHLKEEA